MFRDNVPTIRVHTWPLAAMLFDNDILGGPVPTLFGDDDDTNLAAIQSDPSMAHWDLNKIARIFLMPESLDLQEAIQFLKKPR